MISYFFSPMLDLIYISHLHRGRQKSLAYAFGLAKAFSAPLSLLPSSKLGESDWGPMSIWSPSRKTEQGMPYASILTGTSKERFSLYLLGKPSQPAKSNYQSYQIIQRLVDLGLPILWIPYDYCFKHIQNIWITNNGPGLTDHRLKHLIGANFLPRVFQMTGHSLTRIHWNNISYIPPKTGYFFDFGSPKLALELRKNDINLTIYPIPSTGTRLTTSHFQGLSAAQHPILFLPLSTESSLSLAKTVYCTA